MEETLGLEASRQGDTASLRATGQLDLGTVDEFRIAARDVCDGCRELVADLRALDFIDSTGLTALLDLRHSLAGRGVQLRILADEGPVRAAFELTGLRELLGA